MSLVGHGRLGVRSGLRTFSDFIDESASEKHVLAELRPGSRVTGWSLHSGNAYVAPFRYRFDGFNRDIVGVQSLLDTGLTRVESLTECVATSSTYFYEPDDGTSSARWDDNINIWDGGAQWDVFPKLYVNLGGTNPETTVVEVFLGFYFGSAGEIHPDLGPDKLLDGEFEDWASSSDLNQWVEVPGASGVISRESTTVKNGTYAVKMALVGASTGQDVVIRQTVATVTDGAVYRLSGYYLTPSTNPASMDVYMRLQENGANLRLTTDGRSYESAPSNEPMLDATGGEWRRFSMDFISLGTSISVRPRLLNNTGGTASGEVYFDGLKLQRIFRYNYYEPRLHASSIPESESGSNDVLFGGKKIGVGTVTLANGDAKIEKLFGDLDWANKECRVYVGGTFADGQEILIDDQRRAFTGLIQGVEGDDREIALELQDTRAFFHTELPIESESDLVNPGLDQRFLGRPRPLWFGAKANVTPIGLSKDQSTGYRTYELADCTKSPAGLKSVDSVYAYVDEEAARTKRTDRRKLLTVTTDYTTDLPNGRLSIVNDVGPYEVNADNNQLDFNIGGGSLVATLTAGLYTATGLATEVASQLTAAAATSISCTYNQSGGSAHKFVISKGAGTLQLLCQSGTSKSPAWSLIGFAKSANRTGALSYTGDTATFLDADKEHVIRVDGKGFKDDASGTYTGVASNLIEIGADICRVIVNKYLGKPLSIIDPISFALARSRAPESLSIYLNETTSSKLIFDTLEYSNVANINVDGEGKVYYDVYVGEVPADVTDFFDYDFLDFKAGKRVADVYATIKVLFDKDPSTNEFAGVSATEDSTKLRSGRPDLRTFETYIKKGDNAQAAAQRMTALTSDPVRVVKFSAKGKLVDKRVGTKIRLTRSRALDPSGKLSNSVMRIISLRQSHIDARTYVECVDDVATVAGIACLTACQFICESSCQVGCQLSCESACETSCQAGCQTGCQDACQTGCQTGCQVACQSGCQVACQGACQTGCQSACETACQSSCQLACQTGCQVSCETGCEVSCQTGCQTSCQTGCEVNCQSGCQQACQTNCQFECQTHKEIGF